MEKQQKQQKQEINDITLKCLMNDNVYEKYMQQQEKENNKNDKENMHEKRKQYKFYKKRVLAMTKNLYKKQYDPSFQHIGVSSNVQESFNQYIDSLFEYFTIEDFNDIIQDDLKETMPTQKQSKPLEGNNNFDLLKCNQDIMIQPNKKNFGTLGSFVITKKQKEKETIPLPRKKVVELYNDKLKKKGVRKKKRKKDNLSK
jgi:hypothetical protein